MDSNHSNHIFQNLPFLLTGLISRPLFISDISTEFLIAVIGSSELFHLAHHQIFFSFEWWSWNGMISVYSWCSFFLRVKQSTCFKVEAGVALGYRALIPQGVKWVLWGWIRVRLTEIRNKFLLNVLTFYNDFFCRNSICITSPSDNKIY